jgi:hypothetical protein
MVVAVQKAAGAPAASRHYLLSGRVRLCFVSRKTRENGPEMASALLLFCEPRIINPISLIVPMCHWDEQRTELVAQSRVPSTVVLVHRKTSHMTMSRSSIQANICQYLPSRLINECSVGLQIVFQLSCQSINTMNRNSIQDLDTIQSPKF